MVHYFSVVERYLAIIVNILTLHKFIRRYEFENPIKIGRK